MYTRKTNATLLRQHRVDTFFDIRIPLEQLASDSSYVPSATDSSVSTDFTSLATDISGDTILSFGMLSVNDFSADIDLSDGDESVNSEVSLIGWDTV